VIGGEALTAQAVEAWRRDHTSAAVINEYGPTEATVGCCVHVVYPGQALEPGPVPIGRPVPGTRLFVLDASLQPVGDGEIGELYISGDQLARGYLGRPALTAASFVANPFGRPGARMYRTGDLVRRRNDGLLNFVGRADGQLKIGGIRIEPAEIETVIAESGHVSEAVVTTYSPGAGQQQLVAYVTAPGGVEADMSKLRQYVSALLPGPMLPAAYVVMDGLPLTASGKIDYSALPTPGQLRSTSRALPQTREETVLSRLFSELTGVSPVGIDDDFFALGGSSLAAARLVVRARHEGIFFQLQDVLSMRTTRKLAGRGRNLPAEQQADRS
jgi:acyl-coenzyme A synthetase/AMP-(fatty) acid ligase